VCFAGEVPGPIGPIAEQRVGSREEPCPDCGHEGAYVNRVGWCTAGCFYRGFERISPEWPETARIIAKAANDRRVLH
jgi:hypothetical protein